MQASIAQLVRVSIFQDLKPEDLARLLVRARVRDYRKAEIIMHEGDRLPPQLYALVKGSLQVAKTAASGKETIVRPILAGEIFAAPAMFGNGIAPATVRCEADSQVLTVEREPLLETIRHNPEVALRMLEVFNQRLQQLHNTVHGLISERAIVRLVRLIQYYAACYGTDRVAEGERLRVKLPYYQMARSIGITYEECVRLCKTMKGAISYQRGGTISISDRPGLDAIAQTHSLTGNSKFNRSVGNGEVPSPSPNLNT
ncbi:MAG: Crp/Fnr family transcriptional regulator [Cyanobacteriota bacterium]|nr:Crp/Fnr family transcriptional regulator [Cyanobacteriota bacterium]